MIRNLHPTTSAAFFVYVILIPILFFNPVFSIISLVCSSLLYIILKGSKALAPLFGYAALILIIAVTNPLFSHNGATILFFINDYRITLEALIYGTVFGSTLVSVIIWFGCFHAVFDSEKLMFLIGKPFPKLALVFSMALNFIPRFIGDFKSINAVSPEKNRLRRYLGAFSAVITRSMEGAIITSDSMKARGYGQKKRTFFSRFRFKAYDAAFLFVFTALFAAVLARVPKADFYPYFELSINGLEWLGAAAYGVLALLPCVMEIKLWKYSHSKI